MRGKIWWNEGQVIYLQAHRIVPGENDRTVFDQAGLEELAASIKEHGLAQPITVRPIPDPKTPEDHWDEWGDCTICGEAGRCQCEWQFQLVAGERRFRAVSTVLGWIQVPCIIRDLTDEQASAIMLAENISRKDLDPVDEAQAYQKRVDQFSWTHAEIAERCGVSADRVKKRLRLLKVRVDILHLVRSGNFPSGHAEALSCLDHNRQMMAARPLIEGQTISLRQFRGVVDKLYAEQSQESLLDLALFSGNALQAETVIHARTVEVSALPDLPEMKITYNTHTGEAIFGYVRDLQEAGMFREAQVAATILYHLSRLNLARLPVQVA